MFDPDDTVNGIQAYLNLKLKKIQSPLYFFYVANENKGISEEDLKNSFFYFIEKKFPDANVKSLNQIKNDFDNLSTEDKSVYFSSNMYVIDCSEIEKDTLLTYNSLYTLSKNSKAIFFYYTSSNKKKLLDFSMQFKSSGVYSDLEKELHVYYQYNTLKESMTSSLEDKPQKKNKL